VLRQRASIYPSYVDRPGFLDPRLVGATRAVQARLAAGDAA